MSPEPNFKPYLNDDFKRQVKDIIDCIVDENGEVNEEKLGKDIYEYILFDVKTACMKLAKEYMQEEGFILVPPTYTYKI